MSSPTTPATATPSSLIETLRTLPPAGVSAPTITKIERGNPSVAIGTVFEAARLVGVELFGDHEGLASQVMRSKLALLPQRGRARRKASNDF